MYKTCNYKDHTGERLLPVSDFHKDKYSPDGYKSMCATCSRQKSKNWRAERAKDPEWRKRFNEANTVSRKKGGKVHQLFYAAKGRAVKKNIEFTITKQDIDIPSVCPILHIPIESGEGRKSDDPANALVGAKDSSPSLDRIDNTKGYTPDNVMIISWRANYLKNTASLEEMVALGKWAEQILANSNK